MLSTNLPSQRAVAIWTALSVIGISVLFSILYAINSFFETYRFRFQTPIIVQAPMWIERRIAAIEPVEASPSATPKTTPAPTAKPEQSSIIQAVYAMDKPSDKTIIMGKTNGDIVWKVYGLESSWGKNDGCKDNGKFNGFGYGQNTKVWNCFETFEEVAHKVSVWFETKMQTMSLSEALCLYNTGVQTKTCGYYQKYLSL